MWFRTLTPSEKVRIRSLEDRVQTIEDVLAKNSKERKELLEIAESLDRITKRSFRLKEQLAKLEQPENIVEPEKTLQRADILRTYGRR